MYWWVPVSIAAVVIGAMFGYAYGRTGDDLPANHVSLATPAITSPLVENSTATPVTNSAAWLAIDGCFNNDRMFFHPANLSGCMEQSFANVEVALAPDETLAVVGLEPEGSLWPAIHLVWKSDGVWNSEELRDGGPLVEMWVVDENSDPYNVGSDSVRVNEIGGTRIATVLFDSYRRSSSRRMAAIVLAFEQGRWRVRWSSDATSMGDLAHTTISFDAGADSMALFVQGDSFFMSRDGDPKSSVFAESNAGPHRVFQEKWVLHGDQYVRDSQVVAQTPYNTIVEFLFALRSGDAELARTFATDDLILEAARALGLDEPRAPWTPGDSGEGDFFTIYDESFLPNVVVIETAHQGRNPPLISSIRLTPRLPDQ